MERDHKVTQPEACALQELRMVLDQQPQGVFPPPSPCLAFDLLPEGNIVPRWEPVQPRLAEQRETRRN